jgi:hypothetical protein
MRSLVEEYNLKSSLSNWRIPEFIRRYPVGPNFSLELTKRLIDSSCCAECVDFDYRRAWTMNSSAEISGSGDYLYVVYRDPSEWIYICSSDLNWGIIFSNLDHDMADQFGDLELSRIDFAQSYRTLSDQSTYYDVVKLADWARLAGFSETDPT